MNENDINVLLDHFVGGLDSSESANVAQKIDTIPVWSKTYSQLYHFFGSLNTIKEQDNQQPAPEGLASKTFQKILEQDKKRRASSEFIAQKSDASEQTVQTKFDKRSFSVKPSFLALSACAGFLFIVALTLSTSFFGNSMSKPGTGFINTNSTVNNPTDFAVTGASQQPSSPLFFCSDSVSDVPSQIPFSNDVNSFALNSSEQLVDLTGTSVGQRVNPVKMACPDSSFVVFSSQSEGRPIILVQPLPSELKNIQNVVNQPHVNFVAPVNYQK